MTPDESRTIQANFRGTLGRFTLDASFEVPAMGITALFGCACRKSNPDILVVQSAEN